MGFVVLVVPIVRGTSSSSMLSSAGLSSNIDLDWAWGRVALQVIVQKGAVGMYLASVLDAFPSDPRCILSLSLANTYLMSLSPLIISSRVLKKKAPSST